MKPTYYGVQKLIASQTTKVPTEEINVPALIETFENNQDKQLPADWLELYGRIEKIYTELFTKGGLSQETLDNTSFEVLQFAHENIDDNFDEFDVKPQPSDGRNYYYEYARSFGSEMSGAKMKQHLDEECDFI